MTNAKDMYLEGMKKFATTSMLAVSMLTVPNFKSEAIPLLRSGLMLNISSSRPAEYLFGEIQATPKRSTARALLKHAGKWVGNDLDKCFKEVFDARGVTRF